MSQELNKQCREINEFLRREEAKMSTFEARISAPQGVTMNPQRMKANVLYERSARKRVVGDPRFHAVLTEMGVLHDKKQSDYGLPEDPFSNIRAGEDWGVEPWVSALIRANDKVKRLQKAAKGGELSNEGIEDSLIDLANYAVISLVLFREQQVEKDAEGENCCGDTYCSVCFP